MDILINDGLGNFALQSGCGYPWGTLPAGMASGDFDADGRDALLTRTTVASPAQVPEGLLQALHDAPPEVAEQFGIGGGGQFDLKRASIGRLKVEDLVYGVIPLDVSCDQVGEFEASRRHGWASSRLHGEK